MHVTYLPKLDWHVRFDHLFADGKQKTTLTWFAKDPTTKTKNGKINLKSLSEMIFWGKPWREKSDDDVCHNPKISVKNKVATSWAVAFTVLAKKKLSACRESGIIQRWYCNLNGLRNFFDLVMNDTETACYSKPNAIHIKNESRAK